MKPQIKTISFLALLSRNLPILLLKIRKSPWKCAPQVRPLKARGAGQVCAARAAPRGTGLWLSKCYFTYTDCFLL